jgi:hypothetical protein
VHGVRKCRWREGAEREREEKERGRRKREMREKSEEGDLSAIEITNARKINSPSGSLPSIGSFPQ